VSWPATAGQPIVELAQAHSTVSVERAVLRLAGLDGADDGGMPWVNRLVDAVRETTGLEYGVALPAWDALVSGGYPTLGALARAAAAGTVKFRVPDGRDAAASPGGGQIGAARWHRHRGPAAGRAGGHDPRDGRATPAVALPHRGHR